MVFRGANWIPLLAAVLFLGLASTSEASVRRLQGPYPYVQCGGSGNGCTGSKCKDAEWPGFKCKTGLKCYRISPYYWQCDTHQPPMETIKPTPSYTPSDFHQCGGEGGTCVAGSKTKPCADKKWPDGKSPVCAKGLTCYRVSKWHWGCDTHQPTSG